ncbi:MAG: ABC transporter permease, partial [Spirochaetales bacterium]
VVLLVAGSETPARALKAFFLAPLQNKYYLGNMLNSMTTLLIAGLGIVVAFRSGLYNLGGEGQIYVSAFVVTVLGLAMPDLPASIGIPVLILAGALSGGLMAGLSGLLRRLWKTPEIITSFLLSAAMVPVIDYLVTGPANDPARNLNATRTLPAQFWLSGMLQPSQLNTGLILALLLAGILFLLMFSTVWGYELRLFGLNERFAEYAGIPPGRYAIGSLAVSGALHGITGAVMILGTYHATISGFTGGVGWNAIAVALVARLHPLGAIPAALLFAYLEAGAKASMLHTEFTIELGTIIQGVVFLFVTASIVRPRIRRSP